MWITETIIEHYDKWQNSTQMKPDKERWGGDLEIPDANKDPLT